MNSSKHGGLSACCRCGGTVDMGGTFACGNVVGIGGTLEFAGRLDIGAPPCGGKPPNCAEASAIIIKPEASAIRERPGIIQFPPWTRGICGSPINNLSIPAIRRQEPPRSLVSGA